MTSLQSVRRPRALAWGLGVLLVLAVFLCVNAAWLYVTAGDEAIFEQDTGVSLSEVAAAYPGVTAALTSITRSAAVMMLALALAVGGSALHGIRVPGAASAMPGVVPWAAALSLIGLGALILAQGRVGLGVYHLVFGTAFAVGQMLVNRGARAR